MLHPKIDFALHTCIYINEENLLKTLFNFLSSLIYCIYWIQCQCICNTAEVWLFCTLCPGTLWVPPGGPTTKWISAISSLLNMTVFLQRTNERDPYIQCHQCNITCCLGRQHNRAMHKRKSDSPLSDGGIQALPVTSLNGVVVADVLLLVLLNSRGWDRGQFFGRKQLSGHFTNTCQLLRGGFHDRGSGNLWQNTDIQNDTKSIYYTYM